MRSYLLALVFVTAAACGNKSKGPETPTGDDTGDDTVAEPGGHEEHEMEHEGLTPEMQAFHDTLAPLWHSEEADRMESTCKTAGRMLELGVDIQNAPAPEGAADDWADRVRAMLLAIDQLREDCNAGSGDFDANFTAVHEGFHGLMDALPKG